MTKTARTGATGSPTRPGRHARGIVPQPRQSYRVDARRVAYRPRVPRVRLYASGSCRLHRVTARHRLLQSVRISAHASPVLVPPQPHGDGALREIRRAARFLNGAGRSFRESLTALLGEPCDGRRRTPRGASHRGARRSGHRQRRTPLTPRTGGPSRAPSRRRVHHGRSAPAGPDRLGRSWGTAGRHRPGCLSVLRSRAPGSRRVCCSRSSYGPAAGRPPGSLCAIWSWLDGSCRTWRNSPSGIRAKLRTNGTPCHRGTRGTRPAREVSPNPSLRPRRTSVVRWKRGRKGGRSCPQRSERVLPPRCRCDR